MNNQTELGKKQDDWFQTLERNPLTKERYCPECKEWFIWLHRDEHWKHRQELRFWFASLPIYPHCQTMRQCDGCQFPIHAEVGYQHFEHRKGVNNMTKNKESRKAVLEMMFILMPEAMTIRVNSFERENLGALKSENLYAFSNINTKTSIRIHETGSSSLLSYQDSLLILKEGIFSKSWYGNNNTQKIDFDYLKKQLSEWVEKNCFFGTEKPFPRLERDENSSSGNLLITVNDIFVVSDAGLGALANLGNTTFPIWKDKRFEGEWTCLYPIGIEDGSYAIPDALSQTILNLHINHEPNLEIWKFQVFEL